MTIFNGLGLLVSLAIIWGYHDQPEALFERYSRVIAGLMLADLGTRPRGAARAYIEILVRTERRLIGGTVETYIYKPTNTSIRIKGRCNGGD